MIGCRTSAPEVESSAEREFEDAEDICRSVRDAAQVGGVSGGTAGSGSPAEHFQKLRAVELNIIEGLLDAYNARKSHLKITSANKAPAPDSGTMDLPDAKVFSRDDHGICSTCELPEVERRLGYYRRQKNVLQHCTSGSAASSPEPERTDAKSREMLVSFLKTSADNGQVCHVVGKLLAQDAPLSCGSMVLRASCQAILGESMPAGADAAERLLGDSDLRAAAIQCVGEAAGPDVADIMKSVLSAAQRALFEGKDGRSVLALAACEGGAKILGHTVSETPQADFENACSTLNPLLRSSKSRSRMDSCLRTGRDICEIFLSSGKLNVDQLLDGVDVESPTQIQQVIKAADSEICSLSGEVSVACNMIRKAAEQIREAIKNGDNDWAHCLGTDQLGACIGTLWGQRGWSNNSGVASAVREGDLIYRPCCWCYKDHFIDDSWLVADSRIKRGNWFGAVQEGDFASGNCKHQEKIDGQSDLGETYMGKRTYARYVDCGKWFVKGDRCAVPPGHRHQVWNGNSRSWYQVTAN